MGLEHGLHGQRANDYSTELNSLNFQYRVSPYLALCFGYVRPTSVPYILFGGAFFIPIKAFCGKMYSLRIAFRMSAKLYGALKVIVIKVAQRTENQLQREHFAIMRKPR